MFVRFGGIHQLAGFRGAHLARRSLIFRLAPFIVTWLIAATGDKASPAYYVAFSALVGVFGLLLLRERPR